MHFTVGLLVVVLNVEATANILDELRCDDSSKTIKVTLYVGDDRVDENAPLQYRVFFVITRVSKLNYVK
jgi:hypothetical protein